jgi:hypothetical protein
MKRWVRRLRGILGIGVLWSFTGGILGVLAGGAASLLVGLPFIPAILVFGASGCGAGLVLGAAFASLLTLAEGRRSLEELSTARAALWGGLAGAVLISGWIEISLALTERPAFVLSSEQIGAIIVAAAVGYGAISAVMAAGTVAIAKRAPTPIEGGGSPGGLRLEDGLDQPPTE